MNEIVILTLLLLLPVFDGFVLDACTLQLHVELKILGVVLVHLQPWVHLFTQFKREKQTRMFYNIVYV